MPDDILLDKAQQEWERLQKALKKDSQNPNLLRDLYRLYVSVEEIYWENNEKASSSTQTKKEAKKLRKLEKFFLGIVKKSGLDTDTVHRNLAKDQIKTLQGLLEKYPYNTFLHNTFQATINELDPWIDDNLDTSQEISSEDQLKWKSLKKEAEDWLTTFKNKHDSELHLTKVGWQLQRRLTTTTTDPVVKYLLLKDLEGFKPHIETIYRERQDSLRSLIKERLLGGLEEYRSDVESIRKQHVTQGVNHLIKNQPNLENIKDALPGWQNMAFSYVRPFYDFGGIYVPKAYDPWKKEDISNINAIMAYELTIKNKEHFPKDFFPRVRYFYDRFIEFRENYPNAASYLKESAHVFWDEGKKEYCFKDPRSSLNLLAKELDPKLESFLSNTKADIDHLEEQYKKIVSWEALLQEVKKNWTSHFAQDFASAKEFVDTSQWQQETYAWDQISNEDKEEGIKKLPSEALDLHQFQEKYEVLRLLREQDLYNIAWHEETEKTIAEIETVIQNMSRETIKKKIAEIEPAIINEKQTAQGQTIIATSLFDYLKSPYLRAQLKAETKIATVKETYRQLKLRLSLLRYDFSKTQQGEWQAFLKKTEENYQRSLSQTSPDIATWRQTWQELRQVDENFEEDILKEHLREKNIWPIKDQFKSEKCKARIWRLTLGNSFSSTDNAILQKRFNRLTDHLGSSFNDKTRSLSYKDLTIVENLLPEMQAGRNTKLDCVLYSLKQEYSRKLTAIGLEEFSSTKERKLRTLYQKYAQKAQALVKVSPPQHRQDRQIFSNIMQASHQFVKQNKKMYPLSSEFLRYREFVTIQELLNHTNNSYIDNYWLYAHLDGNWVSNSTSEQSFKELKTWVEKCPSHVDLNLLAVEKYWNDCVFMIKQWSLYNENTPVSNIKAMIDYFLPVAKELVEVSSSQHLKERKRFLDALNKSSSRIAKVNQHNPQLSQDEIGKFSTTHDPFASMRDTYSDFDNNDSISLLIRNEKMMPFPDMRDDPILGSFSSSPQHDPTYWRHRGTLYLTSPAQGWQKVQQLVQQGVIGIELEKALIDVVKDAGLKADTTVKLRTQVTELQQQHKSSHDILEALQKTINIAKAKQNPWRFSNTQSGGLVSRVSPSSEPSTTFSSSTPSFYSWEPAFDPSLKLVDEQFPFNTTSGAFIVVTPGMATQADKKRSAYVFNQPQQGFSFGQGQSAFYLPSQLEQGEFNSPHRHSNPSTPIEMPSQELPDMEELRNGAVFAWIYTPKVVETQIMNQARVVQLPVQVSQRIAIGAESFRNFTQRSFLPNTSKGYNGRIIPLHSNHSSPSTNQTSTSSSSANSSLAKGVGYYMIGRVAVSFGHEIYQGIKGQQSWTMTAQNLADLAVWVVVGVCFSLALPKVALVAGTGVIAHDFVTYVLPPRHSNSYLTPSENLILQTRTLQRDYGDKAVMSFPMFSADSHIHIHTGDLNDAQQKVADTYYLRTHSIRHIQPTRTHYDLQLLTFPSTQQTQQVTTFVVGYWDKNKFHPLKQPIATNYQDLRIHGAVKKSNLAGLKLDDKTQHVLGISK